MDWLTSGLSSVASSLFGGGGAAKAAAPASAAAPLEQDDDVDVPEHENTMRSEVFGLDLIQVFPRVFVAGAPWHNVTSVGSCRNNVTDLAAYLSGQFGTEHYLLFNLAASDACHYDSGKFNGQVLAFPPVLDDSEYTRWDDGLMTVAEGWKIAYTLHFWLTLHPANVAVLHDLNGRTRTAFAVSCYLSWAYPGEFTVPIAFSHYMETRVKRTARVRELPHSWWEFLKAFQTLTQMKRPLRPRKLMLLKLVLSMHGDVEDQCLKRAPIVQVYAGGDLVWDSSIDATIYTSSGSSASGGGGSGLLGGGDDDDGSGSGSIIPTGELMFDEGELKADIQRYVEGDVQIHVYAEVARHRTISVLPTPSGTLPDLSQLPSDLMTDASGIMGDVLERKLLVRYAFHTSLMPAESIMTIPATSRNVDLPSKLVRSDDFRLIMVLSDPPPASPAYSSSSDSGADAESTPGSSASGAADASADPAAQPARRLRVSSFATASGAAGGSGAELAYSHLPGGSSGVPHPLALGGLSPTAAEAAGSRPVFNAYALAPGTGNDDAAIEIVDASGAIDWSFADLLNLRGRLALLAGLYHLACSHSIFPQGASVEALKLAGAPDMYFAAVAVQLAARDLTRARALIATPFMMRLMEPVTQQDILDAAAPPPPPPPKAKATRVSMRVGATADRGEDSDDTTDDGSSLASPQSGDVHSAGTMVVRRGSTSDASAFSPASSSSSSSSSSAAAGVGGVFLATGTAGRSTARDDDGDGALGRGNGKGGDASPARLAAQHDPESMPVPVVDTSAFGSRSGTPTRQQQLIGHRTAAGGGSPAVAGAAGGAGSAAGGVADRQRRLSAGVAASSGGSAAPVAADASGTAVPAWLHGLDAGDASSSVGSGPISQLMLSVVATALANLAHSSSTGVQHGGSLASFVAGGSPSAALPTGAAASVGSGRPPHDAAAVAADVTSTHEAAHDFLVRNLLALQAGTGPTAGSGGVSLGVAKTGAAGVGGAAGVLSPAGIASALGTTTGTGSRRRDQAAALVKTVTRDVSGTGDPLLYAAALQVAMAIVRAEQSELKQLAAASAPASMPLGSGDASAASAATRIERLVAEYSKVDVHAMMKLVGATRQLLAASIVGEGSAAAGHEAPGGSRAQSRSTSPAATAAGTQWRLLPPATPAAAGTASGSAAAASGIAATQAKRRGSGGLLSMLGMSGAAVSDGDGHATLPAAAPPTGARRSSFTTPVAASGGETAGSSPSAAHPSRAASLTDAITTIARILAYSGDAGTSVAFENLTHQLQPAIAAAAAATASSPGSSVSSGVPAGPNGQAHRHAVTLGAGDMHPLALGSPLKPIGTALDAARSPPVPTLPHSDEEAAALTLRGLLADLQAQQQREKAAARAAQQRPRTADATGGTGVSSAPAAGTVAATVGRPSPAAAPAAAPASATVAPAAATAVASSPAAASAKHLSPAAANPAAAPASAAASGVDAKPAPATATAPAAFTAAAPATATADAPPAGEAPMPAADKPKPSMMAGPGAAIAAMLAKRNAAAGGGAADATVPSKPAAAQVEADAAAKPGVSSAPAAPAADARAADSAGAATGDGAAASASSSSGGDVSRYERMLKIGIPPPAVAHKMRSEGVDPALLVPVLQRLGLGSLPAEALAGAASGSGAAAPAGDSKPALALFAKKPKPAAATADAAASSAGASGPDLSRYERMLRMGVPAESVQHKMQGDGVDTALLRPVLAALGIADPSAAPAGPSPAEAAAAALAAERKKRITDLREEQKRIAEDAKAALQDHSVWGQYFKLLRMGVPLPVVQQKVVMAKLDPGVLMMDATQALPSQPVPLRDDPAFSKYFRMLKMGLPPETVAHNMRREGANELALECVPELPTPTGLSDLSTGLVLSSAARSALPTAAAAAKPKRQRKRFHWEALPSDRVSSKNTIWSAGDGLGEDTSSALIDDDEFNALFTQEIGAGSGGGRGGAAGAASAASAAAAAAKIIYLIDMKRGRNVGIALKKLRTPPETLRRMLMGLTVAADGSMLTHEQLVLLEEMLPTPEEVAVVKGFRGSVARLGEAERFFLNVADVPKSRARASALAFQLQFDARIQEASDRVAIVQRACDQVRSSVRLRKVLDAILKLGNRLNATDDDGSASSGGSTPGGFGHKPSGSGGSVVTAFTLNSLLKLSQTKAFNNRVTLLHYLVSRLEKVDPDTLRLHEDFEDAPGAARLTLELLRSDLNALRTGLAEAEKLVREHQHRVRAGSSALAASGVGSSGVGGGSHGRKPSFGASGGSAPASASAAVAIVAGRTRKKSVAAAAGGGGGGGPRGSGCVARIDEEDAGGIAMADIDAALASVEAGKIAAEAGGSGASTTVPVGGAGTGEAASTAAGVAGPLPVAAPEVETLATFVARAQAVLVTAQAQLETAAGMFGSLLDFFGEEASMSLEAFFTTVLAFVRAFQRARVEHEAEVAKAERLARTQQQAAAAAAAKEKKASTATAAAVGGAATPTAVAASTTPTAGAPAAAAAAAASGGGPAAEPTSSAPAAATGTPKDEAAAPSIPSPATARPMLTPASMAAAAAAAAAKRAAAAAAAASV